MANRAEAYDLSYFEDISSNGALIDDYAYEVPQIEEPQVEEQPERKVVELPRRKERQRQREETKPKLRRNAMRIAKYMMVIGLVTGVSIGALVSEVQLTEINEMINETRNDLEEAKSLEVQLTMQAAQKMTDAQVEEYARGELGMGKLSSSQVVYLHVAQQDRGTVVQETGGGSWLERVWATVRGWFA